MAEARIGKSAAEALCESRSSDTARTEVLPRLIVLCLLCCLACKRRVEPLPRQSSAAPSVTASASAPSKPSRDPRLRQVEQLLEVWKSSQNRREFESYAALYAASFQGTKRVGEQSFRFSRKGWLLDRKSMFTPGLEVAIDRLELVLSGQHVVAFFDQSFTTPSYRDRGRKLVAFAPAGDGFQIVREEMLSSVVLGGGGSVRSLPGFFYARPDGVVLRSEIDERWLVPERRELKRRMRAAREANGAPEELPEDDVLKPDEVKLPVEVTAFLGKTLYVTRLPPGKVDELPPPCAARISRIVVQSVVAETFESVRAPMGYDHVFGNVVLGRFDEPCAHAVWASEAPPGKQYLPVSVTAPELAHVKKLLPAVAGYPTLRAKRLGELVVAHAEKLDENGEESAKSFLLRFAQGSSGAKLLSELAAYAEPRLGFDADADGNVEILTLPHGSFATVEVIQSQGTKVVSTPVYAEPAFVCPG
jgi:hypothetical protein